MTEHFLRSLALPDSLCHRIFCRVPPSISSPDDNKSFILYLPTVVLRRRHNPGFALACRLSNFHKVPLIVVCTVLDDHHLSTGQRKPFNAVCMTARRLAFTLEALRDCCKEFEDHGAGVSIRVHGPKCRNPTHLTLIHRHKPLAVVSDEPFVNPYREYLRRITLACQSASVPCFTVDGSTTVPPVSKLRLSTTTQQQESVPPGEVSFDGAPSKAWIWEKQTNPQRKYYVKSAVQDGHLDAPDLDVKLPSNFFLHPKSDFGSDINVDKLLAEWNDPNLSCPGQRPWTVNELLQIKDVKEWVMKSWPGADTSVEPCCQTNGSSQSAYCRWEYFRDNKLKDYAKRRNQIDDPHAVSRISCYLNLGILSIFDVVHDVWQLMATPRSGYSNGGRKFLDEIIKWREIGYVHTFASPLYHTAVHAIPKWAYKFFTEHHQKSQSLRNISSHSNTVGYTYQVLESAKSSDETWNAMQQYLIETGELHNNARMTWGKTFVHWQITTSPDVDEVLWQLCCLNDRFALDGLSPPSYAGILWCFGWCDKPSSSGVSTKWAHKYRKGPESFSKAKERVNESPIPARQSSCRNNDSAPTTSNKKRRVEEMRRQTSVKSGSTILKFFSPVNKKE